MSLVRSSEALPIYPAKYFSTSPTYDTWTKLSVADIHGLREEPGFEGQNIYFHLNHPIKFVYLVAPIVAIEDVHINTTLLTLDDSSGECINVKIVRKDASKITAGESNTAVKSVDVYSSIGAFEVRIDDTPIGVTTVVKAKCTISKFRDARQLDLKRISVIRDTDEEVAAWRAQVQFKRDVLSKPWVLTSEERATFDMRKVDEEKAARYQAKKDQIKRVAHRERKMEREEKRRLHDERTEQKRRAAEERLNKGAIF